MTKSPQPLDFLFLILLLPAPWLSPVGGETSCPSYQEIPNCSCFVLDDQLHMQCSGSDLRGLRKSLQVLNGPVKSFSVYDLDANVTFLPNGATDNVTSSVFQFQISHSSLEKFGEMSLLGLGKGLENLGIVSSRLTQVPQTTLSSLRRLKTLDLEGNQIQELEPYCFHDVPLSKLSLKSNWLEKVSEAAFWGLEDSLSEVDLSENKLKFLPLSALRRLSKLSSLNLAWNELKDLSDFLQPALDPPSHRPQSKSGSSAGAFDLLRKSLPHPLLPGRKVAEERMDWPKLKYLNLNSNYLTELSSTAFSSMANLRSLSIHLNSIKVIHFQAFLGLVAMETVDLSHNKLRALDGLTFSSNRNLTSVDLSNNHLASVGQGLFQGLPHLREVFLNGNNIMVLGASSFHGSPSVAILHIHGNSLKILESGIFSSLRNLSEVRLSDNYIRFLPQDLLSQNEALTSVSLDGNLLTKIAPGSFDGCRSLRDLRLQNNEIGWIGEGVLEGLGASLEELHLENNGLAGVKGLGALRKIRHVTLSRNNFGRLTGELLPGTELGSLSLGHNSIGSIVDGAFLNQSTLTILFLGNNAISRLGQGAFTGLRSLERLYLQRNNISWIHGDTFSSQTKALQYLDLSFNSLRTINRAVFSGLAFIEEINLSSNLLTSLEDSSFTNLRSLRILDLSNNALSVLHYSATFSTQGLEILKICCNSLVQFHTNIISPPHLPTSSSLLSRFQGGQSHQGQIALKELDLQGNALSSSILGQLSMPRLEVLQVSGNNLTDLDENMLDGFPALNFFSAEKSHITSLPNNLFKSNPSLAVIRLSDNFISHIPDSVFIPTHVSSNSGRKWLSPVRELHLRHNKLRVFPYKALGTNGSQLEVLTLSGNRINTLDLNRISMPRIKQLDMNDNRLTKVMGGSFTKSMPMLQVLDFGENNISRLSDDLVRDVPLAQINFGGNSLQKLPFALSGRYLSSSFVLNMSGNPLTSFSSENPHNFSVMDLYLSDTNVSFLRAEEFGSYPNLHRLVIKRNPLTSLPPSAFSLLPNLHLLDLSENGVEEIKRDAFIGLVTLKSLNLSHNSIKTLDQFHSDLVGLQDLDLSHNQLSRLDSDTFANLGSLVTLRLQGNWLTSLPLQLFGPLARIAVLDLRNNSIETIPGPVLYHLEIRIASFKLDDNPLTCDCDTKELWEWLRSHPKLYAQSGGSGRGFRLSNGGSKFLCERPESVRGRGLLDLDLDSLCSPPAIVKLAIQDIQPSSAIVSWQGGNNSGMQGYMIGYHALNHDDQIRWSRPLPVLSPQTHRLPDLESDTPYLICVLGLSPEPTNSHSNVTPSRALTLLSPETVLRDSPNSKCAQVRTLIPSSGSGGYYLIQRRLGLIVGSSLAFIFFCMILSMIIWIKCKKKKRRGSNGGPPRPEDNNGKGDHNHIRVTEALSPLASDNLSPESYHRLPTNGNTLPYNNHNNKSQPLTYIHRSSTLTRLGTGNGNGFNGNVQQYGNNLDNNGPIRSELLIRYPDYSGMESSNQMDRL